MTTANEMSLIRRIPVKRPGSILASECGRWLLASSETGWRGIISVFFIPDLDNTEAPLHQIVVDGSVVHVSASSGKNADYLVVHIVTPSKIWVYSIRPTTDDSLPATISKHALPVPQSWLDVDGYFDVSFLYFVPNQGLIAFPREGSLTVSTRPNSELSDGQVCEATALSVDLDSVAGILGFDSCGDPFDPRTILLSFSEVGGDLSTYVLQIDGSTGRLESMTLVMTWKMAGFHVVDHCLRRTDREISTSVVAYSIENPRRGYAHAVIDQTGKLLSLTPLGHGDAPADCCLFDSGRLMFSTTGELIYLAESS